MAHKKFYFFFLLVYFAFISQESIASEKHQFACLKKYAFGIHEYIYLLGDCYLNMHKLTTQRIVTKQHKNDIRVCSAKGAACVVASTMLGNCIHPLCACLCFCTSDAITTSLISVKISKTRLLESRGKTE